MVHCPREFEERGVVTPFFDCETCPYSFIYGTFTFCNYVFKES